MDESSIGTQDREALETQLLRIIDQLVNELRGNTFRISVSLGDSLERDLGISSLERVELALRLEKSFGVRLTDSVMINADSPQDLLSALLTSESIGSVKLPEPVVTVGATLSVPDSVCTLIDVLKWHANIHPDRTHIFLYQENDAERSITYGELWRRSNLIALGLKERSIRRGESVAIMLRTEEDFFFAFFGTLLAGAVPVPMYPPFRADRIGEYASRQVAILRNAQARVMITFEASELIATLLRPQIPSLTAIVTVRDLTEFSGLDSKTTIPLTAVWPTADNPALIQYTSGSTGDPKGVLLSHSNLLANIRALRQALNIKPDDIAVSWLPLYHDMGLIGAWLGPLYFGTPIVIMSPLTFLAFPPRWLWAIHAHRATISVAPNFAFDLCVRKINDHEIRELDLGSLRILLNGSEAIVPETIQRFTKRFMHYGFKAEAICPVYGLAECSVGLTVSPLGRLPRIDRVTRKSLQQTGRAEPADINDPLPLQFVSCGTPLPEHEIQITNGKGCPVEERVVGHVLFRGPSVTRGYFRNPDATNKVLRSDGWMDSGDLGYWADNELFVTGRLKDLIIKAGRNLYPHEIEELVGSISGIRKGCVAAFGVQDTTLGTERLILIAETRETSAERRKQIHSTITEQMMSVLGIAPDSVVFSPPGSILKTSSGKIRHAATRDAYLNGRLVQARHRLITQWSHIILKSVSSSFGILLTRLGSVLFTGYVVSLLVLTLPLLWGSLLVTNSKRIADRFIRVWSRVILFLAGCRINIEGVENLQNLGTSVLIANHASYLDAIVLIAALPLEFRFVVKQHLTSYPILGRVIRKAQHLTIKKTDFSQRMAGADEVVDALQDGMSLFLFPEGTFVGTPGLLPFRLGAFRAAVEAQKPIIPIAIRGTRHIINAGTWFLRPGKAILIVGTPIKPNEKTWSEMIRLRDQAKAAIGKASGE